MFWNKHFSVENRLEEAKQKVGRGGKELPLDQGWWEPEKVEGR